MIDVEINRSEERGRSPFPVRAREAPHSRAYWVALALLGVALVGATVSGYHMLRKNGVQISQALGLLDSVADINSRLTALQTRVGAWAGDWDRLTERVEKLERKMNASAKLARKQAEELTTQLEERMEDEIEERSAVVDARLDQLETEQGSDRARLTRLEEELSSVRQELAAVRRENTRDVAALNQQIAGTDRATESLARQLARRRVEFEVPVRKPLEISSGVILKVTRTNQRYQRFSGWVRLVSEGRTLWFERHGTQQPVVIYRQHDGERCELVITHVARSSIVGFVLLPVEEAGAAGAPLVSGLETSSAAAAP